MAENIVSNSFINSGADLVTTREDVRAGFVAMALEKNYLAVPYVQEAKVLKTMALKAGTPQGLLKMREIRSSLISASGLSTKALNYLTEDNIDDAISGLIEEFLEPAGEHFPEELVYRYLLVKGDALGGQARNLAGSLGERKFLRVLISTLKVCGIEFYWMDSDDKIWKKQPKEDSGIEKKVKGLAWTRDGKNRVLLMNMNVPVVKKNVDLCLLNTTMGEIILKGSGAKNSAHRKNDNFISLGELKGGIDPAGADEHWKTANSALNRVRRGFQTLNQTPSTFFVGAAIENGMAGEIYNQLVQGTMNNAANLHHENQLIDLCNWLLNE